MRTRTAFLLPLILASCAPAPSPEARDWNADIEARRARWEPRLGERVSIEGLAENDKIGPGVGELGIADFRSWPADVQGKRVRATGTLIARDDLPVFPREKYADREGVPAGIPVPAGVDLEKARRRYLLKDVDWSRRDP